MKIKEIDISAKNRTPLQELIPLAYPLSVYIEPTNLCNIKCSFCPTGNRKLLQSVGRRAGVMDWRIFRTILKDLQEFNSKIKIINYYKDGEPLVNKNFPEMAKEIKDSNICEQLWFKTNGLLLTPSIVKRLSLVNFDMIGISVIAPSSEGYKKISGVDIDYENFIGKIKFLFENRTSKLYIKMANVNFTTSEIQKFYDDFEPISDFIAIENIHSWSRTDLNDFALGIPVPESSKIVCTSPMYRMMINWNGTVQPCCADWSWNNIMGDINKNTLKEIWNSKVFTDFRKLHLEGKRFGNKACGTCSQIMSQIDNIDSYRDELLCRL
jgi:radical SAM protein with 4Fe4S-binding SPASM domain